jgi:hypothetical protein
MELQCHPCVILVRCLNKSRGQSDFNSSLGALNKLKTGRLKGKIPNIKALGLNSFYRRNASRQTAETSNFINKTAELIKEDSGDI